ncbi:MAG: DEAD/DEAH box helicase, partial [Actinobacteria bacterium]|nr:DEAD/DEAH box helicase [Actinomycetota bacterium]
MNPFATLDAVRRDYRTYVETFQRFRNDRIRAWVGERSQSGELLWKPPLVEINRRFARGEPLPSLAKRGVVHADAPPVFRARDANGKLVSDRAPVPLHAHQSAAVSAVLEQQRNVIVATGTGSGKSFCFAIPIVSECLRLRRAGVAGVKALIVYPMNALANSQYRDLAERLAGTGLTLARYTGDTKRTREEALAAYRETFGEDQPFDSELIDRESIQATPPDILMTNYVQLELLLTRLEDQRIFRPEHRGALRFLVLDELHTYGGKRGADVALLIRRLKHRTGTAGALRCIGTSATMQSEAGEDADAAAATFASKLFGEPFDASSVIRETEEDLPDVELAPLPADVTVTRQDLDAIDPGDLATAAPLVAALTGRTPSPAELTPGGLGVLLASQPTLRFLERELRGKPVALDALATRYVESLRPGVGPSVAQLELEAALLLGMAAHSPGADGQLAPRLVAKAHGFFTQGRVLAGCLGPDCGYLSDRG